MKASKEEIERIKTQFRESVPHGSTIYAIVRSVSHSGMSRKIDLFTITKSGHPCWWTYGAHILYHETMPKRGNGYNGDGSRVGGCGMDMVRHFVGSVHRAVYGADNFNDDPNGWTIITL